MSKNKYSLRDDFIDTFFRFQNHQFTPVKMVMILMWLVLLFQVVSR